MTTKFFDEMVVRMMENRFTQSLRLKEPTRDDIPSLAKLGAETFCATFGHLYSQENLDEFLDKVYSVHGVTKDYETPGMKYTIAECDGQLVGYSKIGPLAAPVPKELAALGRTSCEMRQLYVIEECKGKGVARTLMDRAMSQLRATNPDDIYLSVFSENERAQRFYQRYGFKKCGEYSFMVGDHADREYIYRLALRPE